MKSWSWIAVLFVFGLSGCGTQKPGFVIPELLKDLKVESESDEMISGTIPVEAIGSDEALYNAFLAEGYEFYGSADGVADDGERTSAGIFTNKYGDQIFIWNSPERKAGESYEVQIVIDEDRVLEDL